MNDEATQNEQKAQDDKKPQRAGESNSTDLLYSVEENLMKRMYFALETARDNAIELYNDHMNKVGGKSTTKKYKYLAKLLKDDADEATDLIKGLTDKYGRFGI